MRPSPRRPRLESLHAIDLTLLGGALLILAGIASSLLARRFGAPLLLVFLLLGLLLGEDGPGGVRYNDTRFTFLVGSLALSVILFDGVQAFQARPPGGWPHPSKRR